MPVVGVVVLTSTQLAVLVVLAAVEMVEQTPLVQEIMAVVEQQTQAEAVVLGLELLELLQQQLEEVAVQVLSLSKSHLHVLQLSQAVLHPRYRLLYQDLRCTP
jgi:hypothetical protein